MLIQQSDGDAAMKWARGSEQKELSEQQQENKKAETPVIQMLLQQNNKTMMENFDEQTLLDDVAKFQAQKIDVDRLSAKVKQVLEMHRAKPRMRNSGKT